MGVQRKLARLSFGCLFDLPRAQRRQASWQASRGPCAPNMRRYGVREPVDFRMNDRLPGSAVKYLLFAGGI